MGTSAVGLPAIAIALFAFSAAAAPSYAQKQTRPTSQASSIQAECFKRHGAAYDAATKKWVLWMWHESDRVNKLDAVRDCISRGTGIPRGAIAIPEITIY
jgi:hypothetical protein